MSKSSWQQRQKELADAFRELRKNMDDSDPVYQQLLKDTIRKYTYVQYEEELDGIPEWVEKQRDSLRRDRTARMANKPKWDAIQTRIEKEIGDLNDLQIWPGCDPELRSVRYDIWFQTDENLRTAKNSGETNRLISIIKSAATEIAGAKAQVCLHSFQYLKEKCNNDIRGYLG